MMSSREQMHQPTAGPASGWLFQDPTIGVTNAMVYLIKKDTVVWGVH
jgi:hypothetical protein